jgi:hypothetical protein
MRAAASATPGTPEAWLEAWLEAWPEARAPQVVQGVKGEREQREQRVMDQ